MYRVYLVDLQRNVSDKTVTHDAAEAAQAFADLVAKPLDGSPVAAVLNRQGISIARHDFTARGPQESRHYWRGRLDKLDVNARAPAY